MKTLQFTIGQASDTPISEAFGVHQDCVLGLCRDADGFLWATAGHCGYGSIGVFRGTTASNLEKQYDAKLLFPTGAAGTGPDAAFGGETGRYPDGPLARGEIWATGLWISPKNGHFYMLVHNETGWGAGQTGYTAFAQEEGEPDFRHIGLVSSEDQGRSWRFEGWVITAEAICYTESYRPDGIQTGGQKPGIVCLGAGDLSVFYHEAEDNLYVFYSMGEVNMVDRSSVSDKIYVARAKVNADGKLSDFFKYHNGAFNSPGNKGPETAIMIDGAEPCVAYSKLAGCYIMTSYNRKYWGNGPTLQVCYSTNLSDWSQPVRCVTEHEQLSMPYFTLCGREQNEPHNLLGEQFDLFVNTNNTDLKLHTVQVSLNP